MTTFASGFDLGVAVVTARISFAFFSAISFAGFSTSVAVSVDRVCAYFTQNLRTFLYFDAAAVAAFVAWSVGLAIWIGVTEAIGVADLVWRAFR